MIRKLGLAGILAISAISFGCSCSKNPDKVSTEYQPTKAEIYVSNNSDDSFIYHNPDYRYEIENQGKQVSGDGYSE